MSVEETMPLDGQQVTPLSQPIRVCSESISITRLMRASSPPSGVLGV